MVVTKCRNRTVVRAASVSNLIHDSGSQAIKTKLMYRTLIACLRNSVNFWSKIKRKYNEVNAELKATEKAIAFLKIGKRLEEIVLMVNSISRTEGVYFL